MKSATFHGFGLGGSIRGAISPEPITYGYETCTTEYKFITTSYHDNCFYPSAPDHGGQHSRSIACFRGTVLPYRQSHIQFAVLFCVCVCVCVCACAHVRVFAQFL